MAELSCCDGDYPQTLKYLQSGPLQEMLCLIFALKYQFHKGRTLSFLSLHNVRHMEGSGRPLPIDWVHLSFGPLACWVFTFQKPFAWFWRLILPTPPPLLQGEWLLRDGPFFIDMDSSRWYWLETSGKGSPFPCFDLLRVGLFLWQRGGDLPGKPDNIKGIPWAHN